MTPYTTLLVGVWVDRSFVFCTGPTEQKARNLEHRTALTVVTGSNTWQAGLDVVVEGAAARVTGVQNLKALADAFRAKHGDEIFDPEGTSAHVFRVTPTKVLAFAKSPHGLTRYR